MKIQLVSSSDKCLRTEAVAVVTPVHRDLVEAIEFMSMYMSEHSASGIAAPQFEVPFRVFVAHLLDDIDPFGTPGLHYSDVVMVNPVVTTEEGSQIGYEGCLSFPGIQAEVERPQRIGVTWSDMGDGHHHGNFTGGNARVIMHEYDHLRGIVFLDHVEGFKQFTQRAPR